MYRGLFKNAVNGGSPLTPYKQNTSDTGRSWPVAKDLGQKEWVSSQTAFLQWPTCKDAGPIGPALPASDTLSRSPGVKEGGQRGFREHRAVVLASSRLHASPFDCATLVLK